MNSNAEKEGKQRAGRGERRYLRLGREDSIALPGEDSLFDELDNVTGTEVSEEDVDMDMDSDDGSSTKDEEKSRRLVGDLLDWEEECTMLDAGGAGESEDTVMEDARAGAQDSEIAESSRKAENHETESKEEQKEDLTIAISSKRHSQVPPLRLSSLSATNSTPPSTTSTSNSKPTPSAPATAAPVYGMTARNSCNLHLRIRPPPKKEKSPPPTNHATPSSPSPPPPSQPAQTQTQTQTHESVVPAISRLRKMAATASRPRRWRIISSFLASTVIIVIGVIAAVVGVMIMVGMGGMVQTRNDIANAACWVP